MENPRPSKRIPRRIGAVLAGFMAGAVLSLGVDGILHATGVYPPWGQTMSDGLFLMATLYRLAFNVFGCWLAARLAPDHPMAHALAIGIIGTVVSAAGAAATWGKGPEFGPMWYPISLVVLSLPCAWLGGKLRLQTLPAAA